MNLRQQFGRFPIPRRQQVSACFASEYYFFGHYPKIIQQDGQNGTHAGAAMNPEPAERGGRKRHIPSPSYTDRYGPSGRDGAQGDRADEPRFSFVSTQLQSENSLYRLCHCVSLLHVPYLPSIRKLQRLAIFQDVSNA